MRKLIDVGRVLFCTTMVLVLLTSVSDNLEASWNAPQSWVVPNTVIKLERKHIDATNNRILTGGLGGEFRVKHVSGSGNPGNESMFYTFCVEKTEFVNLGSNVKVHSLSTTSIQTNFALSAVTSALYREFLRTKNTTNSFFSSLGYSGATYQGSTDLTQPNPSANDAVDLQKAIWHFQNTLWEAYDPSNKYMVAGNWWKNNHNGGFATSLLPGNIANYGGVQIMNLADPNLQPGQNGYHKQDQLIYTGNSGVPAVPEPASFALFGCGLMGCCGFLRRRKIA